MRFSYLTDRRRRLIYPYRRIDGGRRIDRYKRIRVILGLLCCSFPLWMVVLGVWSPVGLGVGSTWGEVGGDVEVSSVVSIEDRLRDSAVMRWLRYFSEGDYYGCDSLVKNTAHRLMASGDEEYREVLDGLVSSLREVSVERVVDTGLGFRFTVRVEFERYKELLSEEIIYPEDEIAELQRSYLSGEIADADIEGYLKDIYHDVFRRNCFEMGNGDRGYCLLDLSEEGGYVYGTVDFVNMLLERTNLIHNMRTYESSVRGGIDALLEGDER